MTRAATTLRRPAHVAGSIGLFVAGPAALAAGAVTYPTLAVGLLIAVIALLLLLKPDIAAVLAVALLPFPLVLPTGLPVELSATDALIVLALLGWLIERILGPHRSTRIKALAPLRIPLAAYGAAMLLSIVVHPSVPAAATLLQRTGLVIGGLLLGAGLVRAGRLRISLEVYLLSASLLSVAAMLGTGSDEFFGVQKNPAGGFISAALFIAILMKPSPRWLMYAPVLAIGLLATQSRGALVGALVGAAVSVAAVVGVRQRARLFVALAGVGALLYAGFSYLPAGAQERLLKVTGASDYAIRFRADFQADALDQFRSSPWTGVGVGSYVGGPRAPGILDPHQVLIFQLAEGGIPLLLAFLVLAIGGGLVVLRHVRASPLALAALIVQISTIVHALADIYWVRGTPTPAWLLIGASLAVVQLARNRDSRGLEWIRWHQGQPRHRRTRQGNGVAAQSGRLPATGAPVG